MSSAAPAFKNALYDALVVLFPAPKLVTYGHPGGQSADDMIGVMDMSSEQELATMGTNRRREETITVEVVISCWRGGTDQQTVTEAAYTILGSIEDYLQHSGTASSTQITLGGVVREARVTSHELTETADPDDLALGRLAEITATITAHVRI